MKTLKFLLFFVVFSNFVFAQHRLGVEKDNLIFPTWDWSVKHKIKHVDGKFEKITKSNYMKKDVHPTVSHQYLYFRIGDYLYPVIDFTNNTPNCFGGVYPKYVWEETNLAGEIMIIFRHSCNDEIVEGSVYVKELDETKVIKSRSRNKVLLRSENYGRSWRKVINLTDVTEYENAEAFSDEVMYEFKSWNPDDIRFTKLYKNSDKKYKWCANSKKYKSSRKIDDSFSFFGESQMIHIGKDTMMLSGFYVISGKFRPFYVISIDGYKTWYTYEFDKPDSLFVFTFNRCWLRNGRFYANLHTNKGIITYVADHTGYRFSESKVQFKFNKETKGFYEVK